MSGHVAVVLTCVTRLGCPLHALARQAMLRGDPPFSTCPAPDGGVLISHSGQRGARAAVGTHGPGASALALLWASAQQEALSPADLLPNSLQLLLNPPARAVLSSAAQTPVPVKIRAVSQGGSRPQVAPGSSGPGEKC